MSEIKPDVPGQAFAVGPLRMRIERSPKQLIEKHAEAINAGERMTLAFELLFVMTAVALQHAEVALASLDARIAQLEARVK